MKRPDVALTGIDRKLSAEVTADFEQTDMASLIEIRAGQYAPAVLRTGLAVAAFSFAVGVYLPGTGWVGALLLSVCVAIGAVAVAGRMKLRAAFFQRRLADRVRREYGAELVAVRRRDVHVTAARTFLTPRPTEKP